MPNEVGKPEVLKQQIAQELIKLLKDPGIGANDQAWHVARAADNLLALIQQQTLKAVGRELEQIDWHTDNPAELLTKIRKLYNHELAELNWELCVSHLDDAIKELHQAVERLEEVLELLKDGHTG